MATATIRALEVIKKEKMTFQYDMSKMVLSSLNKSCENDFYGVVLQLDLVYFKAINTHVFFLVFEIVKCV